jgi:hypothetical protein
MVKIEDTKEGIKEDKEETRNSKIQEQQQQQQQETQDPDHRQPWLAASVHRSVLEKTKIRIYLFSLHEQRENSRTLSDKDENPGFIFLAKGRT